MASTPPAPVPVLMYHQIGEPPETGDRLAVAPAEFARQLAYLHDAGFATITAGEFSAVLAGDAPGELPARPVVLTFDDGFEDFHGRAMPLLDKYGFTATVFVTSGWIQDAGAHSAPGRPGRMLTWSQLAEAAKAGMEIGAHSLGHPQLDQIPGQQLRAELQESKARLEDGLGFAVPGMAYPFGYYNARVAEVTREVGYRYGYAVRNVIARPASDLFAVPRLTVRRATTMATFRRLADGRAAPQLLQDRALTKGYAVVRHARRTLHSRTLHSRTLHPGTPGARRSGQD
jgi:peptidoglycan/xylan/chitin deacetylase (PgdA/CDA1 family)